MRVARSIDELLEGATARESIKHADSKSHATFERVRINGRSHVVKYFFERDWLADASADDECRAVALYESGGYDLVGDVVDHTVVWAARMDPAGAPWPAALLMRDAGAEFIQEDATVDGETHAAFLESMAALHARFWEQPPDVVVMDFARSYRLLSPMQAVEERDRLGDRSDVLRGVLAGWATVETTLPGVWAAVAPVLHDPSPLVTALGTTPRTFLQGDWKMGNLGRRPDGGVVLVDWDRPQVGPPLFELAWYLAVNCDRLPETKEQAIGHYQDALERCGVPTAGWWDDQLDLALLGAFLMLGWSKVGQADEFGWWASVAARAAARL